MKSLVTSIGVVLLAGAAPALAEIIVLANGSTLKASEHRSEGEMLHLSLKGGGEVGLSADEVVSILPDEIVDEVLALPAAAGADEAFARLAREVARRHGVDPDLVAAVVAVESAFEPEAISPKGAMGLMQLMPETAASLGIEDPYDPEKNLDGGVRHLQSLLDHYNGDRLLALAAYNAGAGAVARYGGVPPYSETRAYVRKVLSRIQRSR